MVRYRSGILFELNIDVLMKVTSTFSASSMQLFWAISFGQFASCMFLHHACFKVETLCATVFAG